MATQKTTVIVDAKDNGSIDKLDTKAQKLSKTLEAAAKAANNITGGTKGSRTLSSKASGSGAQSLMGEREYTSARGSAGLTGASARDFAAQSQGLGGLVRLYATWAANIYAVGAAFTALRESANITNMVSGMNQLGAASGIALGSMAKRFADASGGAISLQEAISATVKATSSGLSAKQFEQLGEVARKASRALGIDMSDAVSRLTRGITKLEPELLDELGIFTKVGTAVDEYAKRVGKSASSLSDFERRQAFANAALNEGLTKFGQIDVAANPYDQLAASIKNLTQSSLELVNKVLGPIVGFLSSSPTALATVLAGIGLMIVRQAIPAIGQYRKALSDSADFAAKKWEDRSEQMRKTAKDNHAFLAKEADASADVEVAAVDRAQRKIEALRSKTKGSAGVSQRALDIMSQTHLSDITREDRKYLAGAARASKDKELAAAYREATLALKSWTLAEERHKQTLKDTEIEVNKNIQAASRFSAVGYARDQLERARQSKARTELVSQATEDASTKSMGSAWAGLTAGIKEQQLSKTSAAITKFTGGLAIATTVATRFLSVIAGALGWIGLAAAVIGTLYSALSSNSEASAKLTSSLDSATEASSTAAATFSKFDHVLSAESIVAKSNALSGLASSIADVADKLVQAESKSNTVDRIWEGIKGMFGASMRDNAADAISNNVSQLLKGLDDPELKKQTEERLKKILNVKSLAKGNLALAIEDLPEDKLKKVGELFEDVNVKSMAAAAATKGVMDALKGVNEASQAISTSLTQKDPLSNYAAALATASKTMTEAFKSPTVAANTFAEIVKDMDKLKGFPPEYQSAIAAQATEYTNLTTRVRELNEELKAIEKKQAGFNWSTYLSVRWDTKKQKEKVQVELKATESSLASMSDSITKLASTSLDRAFKVLSTKASAAAAQAEAERGKAILGFLPESKETIRLRTELENRSIDVRIQEITALYNLANEIALQRTSDALARTQDQQSKTTDPVKLAELETEISKLKSDLKVYQTKNIAAAVKSGSLPKSETALSQMMAQQGFIEQLTTLTGQKESARITAALKTFQVGLDEENTARSKVVEAKKAEYEGLVSSTEYTQMSIVDRAKVDDDYYKSTKEARLALATFAERKAVETSKEALRMFPKGKYAEAAQAALADKTETYTNPATGKQETRVVGLGQESLLRQATSQFNKAEDQSTLARVRQEAERKLTAELAQQAAVRDELAQKTELYNNADLQKLDSKSQALALELDNFGIISEAQADRQKAIDLEILAQEKSNALSSAKISSDTKLLELNAKLKAAKSGEVPLSAEALKLLETQIYTEETLGALRLANTATEYDAKMRLREQQLDENTRLGAYTTAFKDSFKAMEDAIIEFTKSGKLNFSSMVDSFIEDLIRFEIRQMQSQMFNNAGGASGLASMVISAASAAFGGSGSSSMYSLTSGSSASPGLGLDPSSSGIGLKAAKGAVFTNSVVNTPTLFKFAKGTGLMGEAGPEAIMPLTRDSMGNLGVRNSGGGGGSVDIVINNYSGETATANESVDSRGNRKVEVVIGDMSSAEIRRSGSSTQQALTSTFGVRPAIIRR